MTAHYLSEAQKEQYRTEGFIVVESVFWEEDLTAIGAAICELTEQVLTSGDDGSILELEPEPVNGRQVPRRIYNPFD